MSEEQTPKVSSRPQLSIDERRKLFEAVDEIEQEEALVQEELDKVQAKKQAALRVIVEQVGKGPFRRGGEEFIIATRKGTLYFRNRVNPHVDFLD